MDRPNFFTAAIPEPHTILGATLRPFSAGHLLLLNRIGNVFADLANMAEHEPVVPGLDDLVTGVWLCRLTYEQGLAEIADVSKWAVSMRDWIAAYNAKHQAIDIPKQCVAFASYIAGGSTVPKFLPIPRDMAQAIEIQVPALELVKVGLLRDHVVESEAQFWDRPWGLCLWDYYVLRAIKGDGQIYDDDNIAIALEAAHAAARGVEQEARKGEKKRKGVAKGQRRKGAKRLRKKGGKSNV